MSAQFPLSEPFTTAEHDRQHFQNQCLKRKLGNGVRNGFVAAEDLEMCGQEQNCISEKRPRFSHNPAHDQFEAEVNGVPVMTNGELSLNSFSSATKDSSSSVTHQGNNMEADSLLQNNLEGNSSCANEEAIGMDIECETDGVDTHAESQGCPPNLNVGLNNTVQSVPCSSTETTVEEGSPAREFLRKHRPEYQMHCIPSYCHPGGLWDVMLEVYHGI